MQSGDHADLPPFLPPTPDGVTRAAELLRTGEVVALPTETVYGLAANALDERAVRYIFSVKGRPLVDPLIVHGLDVEFFRDLAHFTPLARALADACWPGPLTLVLRKTAVISPLVTAGRETVAVRAPAHPVMRAVLTACGLPLAAPSANPFGYISPTRAEHVRASFGGRLPWILDGGPCAVGLESTIVDVSDPAAPPRVLRPGPITPQALASILGRTVQSPAPTPRDDAPGMAAPGLLARHYSPSTPLGLLEPGMPPASPPVGRRVAWIRFSQADPAEILPARTEVFWLSENGDLAQAARGLYDLLRRLDGAGYEKIWCEKAPDSGWGLALNDRLRRAAGQG
jgi:L-threonylcarbamoyladenylate synthase